MTRSRKAVIAGIVLSSILMTQASFADTSRLGDPEYTVKPASVKLWRGVVNAFTGIGEIIRQPVLLTKEDGIVGVPTGLINGVFMALIRTGSGIIEAVTFPLPLDENIGYESLMNPDYVWQKAD